MKDLLEKISSYNIFNYLLPGTVFAYLSTHSTQFYLVQDDILIGAFVYYFIGLIISRVGSLIFEPFLIFALKIKFAPYKEFILAAKNDPKIEVLSEVNNMYRTLFSMVCCIIALMLVDEAAQHFQIPREAIFNSFAVALALIFGLSYKKQTNYIRKRVANSK